MNQRLLSRGITTFITIWLGQTVSLVGSGLTGFALGLWVYQTTGSVTRFALIALCTVLPRIVLSPFAGALVDRGDRRWAMILGDSGAGLSTLVIAMLFMTNQLEVWHIYLATTTSAAFSTLQWPAYAAIMPLLVPKQNLGRANGMVQFSRAASEILSPLLAGVLVLTIQVQGVILIDFATFLFAVSTLLLVRVPRPQTTAEHTSGQESLWREVTSGWTYLKARPGLLGLLLFLAIVNFLWGMLGGVLAPMVLGFTSADMLGLIISIAGVGMLTGSLVMSTWGGPKRRVLGILSFELMSAAGFILIGLKPAVWLVAIGTFTAHVTIAMVSGCNQTLWQNKVAPEMQGRVFATQQMVARAATPLAFLIAGPLADHLFEPLLAAGGPLTASLGQLIGVGTGRGIALMLVVMGLLKLSVSLWGLLYSRIRLVEDEVTDAIPDEPVVVAVA